MHPVDMERYWGVQCFKMPAGATVGNLGLPFTVASARVVGMGSRAFTGPIDGMVFLPPFAEDSCNVRPWASPCAASWEIFTTTPSIRSGLRVS
jgi:hypothetical protein